MRRRPGFSLITVLMVTIVSLAMMGLIVNVFTSTAGSTRIDVSQTDAFNTMQSGVERARAFLASEMRRSETSVPLARRYSGMTETDEIKGIDDLLIRRSVAPYDVIGTVADESVSIGGSTYRLRVGIYDMLYDPERITGSDAERIAIKASLPPAMSFSASETNDIDDPNLSAPGSGGGSTGGTAGIYLIRASLEPQDTGSTMGAVHTKMVETAVVQSLDEEN